MDVILPALDARVTYQVTMFKFVLDRKKKKKKFNFILETQASVFSLSFVNTHASSKPFSSVCHPGFTIKSELS